MGYDSDPAGVDPLQWTFYNRNIRSIIKFVQEYPNGKKQGKRFLAER